MDFLVVFAAKEPSQALPRQLSQRESQVVKLSTKVLGIMRKFSAVPLPLPLGEVALRSKDGEGARCGKYPLSLLTTFAASSPKGTPYGTAGNFVAAAKAVPLDRLSPAGERCRVSDRVGSGWHRRRR